MNRWLLLLSNDKQFDSEFLLICVLWCCENSSSAEPLILVIAKKEQNHLSDFGVNPVTSASPSRFHHGVSSC